MNYSEKEPFLVHIGKCLLILLGVPFLLIGSCLFVGGAFSGLHVFLPGFVQLCFGVMIVRAVNKLENREEGARRHVVVLSIIVSTSLAMISLLAISQLGKAGYSVAFVCATASIVAAIAAASMSHRNAIQWFNRNTRTKKGG